MEMVKRLPDGGTLSLAYPVPGIYTEPVWLWFEPGYGTVRFAREKFDDLDAFEAYTRRWSVRFRRWLNK